MVPSLGRGRMSPVGEEGVAGCVKRLCVYDCVLLVDAGGDVCVIPNSILIRGDSGEKYIQHFIHYSRSQLSSAYPHLRAHSQSALNDSNCAVCTHINTIPHTLAC